MSQEWKEACAVVGELVLLYSALDHQLNRIIIEVMHLGMTPMLEAVVATLDARQKIEILKNRANHVKQKDWKKALTTHADRLERVSRLRNAACHTPMIRNEAKGHFEFAPAAASKLMKSITIKDKNDYAVERLTLERMREIIHLYSQPPTGPSALAPVQRAGAQRLCALAQPGPPEMSAYAAAVGGRTDLTPANPAIDPALRFIIR